MPATPGVAQDEGGEPQSDTAAATSKRFMPYANPRKLEMKSCTRVVQETLIHPRTRRPPDYPLLDKLHGHQLRSRRRTDMHSAVVQNVEYVVAHDLARLFRRVTAMSEVNIRTQQERRIE